MSEGIRRALVRERPGAERFLRFEAPVEQLVARDPHEVPRLLERVEQAGAQGLWAVGFVGYEAAPVFDPALRAHAPAPGPVPLAAFSVFGAPEALDRPEGSSEKGSAARVERFEPDIGEQEHRSAVERIRAAIAEGATYQVNFTFPLLGSFSGDPEGLFRGLLAPGEAPFAALLEGSGWAILSLSPELFFERSGGRLVMRPMKGTRRRGRFPREDGARAAELAASEKDRAENLMIVDMVRNDLGRVARAGSVTVERRFEVERYPTVWQMTSTVTAASEARLPELFAALFPCASVTGAPKPATMRILRELERGPRGVYCGAVGRVEPHGTARFAVAIRTLELDVEAGRFRYGTGSGVTWDSEPGAEWAECLDKARVLDGAPRALELLETMRWRPARGIELLDLHLERLTASALHLGFGGTEASLASRAREAVAEACAGLPAASHRVRLRLGRDGRVRIEAERFEPGRRAWRVAVAVEPVSSEDPALFHKTTERSRYERALAAAPEEVDEVLLVNEHGELTEGTRTNVLLQFGGEWLTPPLEAGLLPGVFREHLLRSGHAVEATLYPHDLRRAHRVRLCNALRGFIPVTATR
jgi:para-aminobenzoate synthetase/4-amino-4-deoxychorismate lyase